MQKIKDSIADIAPAREEVRTAADAPTPIAKTPRRRALVALGACLATVTHAGHRLARIARDTCVPESALVQLVNTGRGVSEAQERDVRAWLEKHAPDVLAAIAGMPAGDEGS